MLVSDEGMVAGAVTKLLLMSSAFQHAEPKKSSSYQHPNIHTQIAVMASAEAFGIINHLCLTVRNMQDAHPNNLSARAITCGHILSSFDEMECKRAFEQKSIPQRPDTKLVIRQALNKFAHFDQNNSSYKIDNGRHALILTGKEIVRNGKKGDERSKFWTVVIDVEQLAMGCMLCVQRLQHKDE